MTIAVEVNIVTWSATMSACARGSGLHLGGLLMARDDACDCGNRCLGKVARAGHMRSALRKRRAMQNAS